MRLLLDAHALLWFAADDRRLGRNALKAIEQDDSERHISVATIWELAIKTAVGKLKLPATVDDYISGKLNAGYRLLPIDWQHAAAVQQLPLHHRDPFDRLLAVQALAEDMIVVTRDRIFRKYGVTTIW